MKTPDIPGRVGHLPAATPVSYSGIPLVFDTLPAIKVRHFSGHMPGGNIYTYARAYVLQGALACSLCAFEETPDDASGMVLCLAGERDETQLRFHLFPRRHTLQFAAAGASAPEELPAPAPTYYKGADEQGWFWGATCTLGEDALARLGLTLAPGNAFRMCLYKTKTGAAAFGASAPHPATAAPFSPGFYAPFLVVPY